MTVRLLIDGDPLTDDSTAWNNPNRPCACGADQGQPCDDQCPAAVATEIAAEARLRQVRLDERCCPSPQAARASLCGCGGAVA